MPASDEIDEMIRLCAAHCMESTTPRSCVKGFVSRLISIRGWAQPDADLVADQALKIIARITGSESHV